jgi:hypothetical protein
MARTIILTATLVMIVTAQGLAQSSDPNLTIIELQKQLVELRGQLAVMQNRIATLERPVRFPARLFRYSRFAHNQTTQRARESRPHSISKVSRSLRVAF